jgi:hypothetical protein
MDLLSDTDETRDTLSTINLQQFAQYLAPSTVKWVVSELYFVGTFSLMAWTYLDDFAFKSMHRYELAFAAALLRPLWVMLQRGVRNSKRKVVRATHRPVSTSARIVDHVDVVEALSLQVSKSQ